MLSMFLFSGCTELDGVFPKFKPQNDQETPAAEHSAASVAAKTGRALLKKIVSCLRKIEQLEQQISTLQNQQNKQRDDFQLLQQQWETNFSLLESSVEQSLNSNMTGRNS